ncbi:MAG: hypothetical protein ACI4R9_07025 [Kiritimatiellia bacterium]
MNAMKGWMWTATAGVLLLTGCGDNEAERFGYKGLDLEAADPMFFSTGPTVTNWVPARVLSVCETYDLSEGEQKLIAAAGVIAPGDEFAEIPAGYTKQDDEPWYTTWTRPTKAFGLEGVVGFLSHYDEDRKVWTTSEGYFSSYWESEAGALAALAKLQGILREGYGVKKFYPFDKCWVAEYVRLRVMAVVGQKADGRWSCMLDIQDKNRPGCGAWEPIAEQQERRNHYVYTKALRAWKAEVREMLKQNHGRVEKSLEAAGLTGLGGAATDWQMTERAPDNLPCLARLLGGVWTNSFEEAWSERLAQIQTSLGLAPTGANTEQTYENGVRVRSVQMQDTRYDVRLDVAQLPESGESTEGETAPAAEPSARPKGEWRVICFERLQPGFVLPVRPVLAK